MPTPYYNDGGTWRQLKGLWYNDGSVWKKLKAVWYNDGGTWRRIFNSLALLSGLQSPVLANLSSSAGTRSIGLQLHPDGTTTFTFGGGPLTNWASPTDDYSASGLYFRFRPSSSSGAIVEGGTAHPSGSWYPMTTSPIDFTLTTTGAHVEDTGTLFVDASIDGGATVASTFYYDYDYGYDGP